MNHNAAQIAGNITRDPELKTTQQGKSYCKFSVAVTRHYIMNGEPKTETNFISVSAWGKTAENVCRYCRKGSGVFVVGRISVDEWTDKETQEKRTSTYITADSVQFTGSKPKDAAPAPTSEHRYTAQDTTPELPEDPF